MYLKTSVFLVVGISKSGVSATEFLLSKGAQVLMIDELENQSALTSMAILSEKGATAFSPDCYQEAVNKADVVVLSPGVPIDNKIPMLAKKLKKRIMGETELAFLYSTCPIIAVTGTNGKTTTCSIISEILSKAKVDNHLVGNIGVPFSSKLSALDNNSVAVAEISSFQLETLSFFSPHVAVVTNVAEDHLSRHYNMQNYIFLKSKILCNLRESEYAVLNYDDYIVRGFQDKTKGKIIFFSTKERVEGAYLMDGKIYYYEEPIIDVKLIGVKGEHNLYNALASIAVAKIFGVPNEIIAEGIAEFKGIKHRIEFVKTVDGVDYYNDSKATNVDSTIKALNSMSKPTVLLLGGRDKAQNFDDLFNTCKTKGIERYIFFGECRYKLLKSAERMDIKNFCIATNLFSAVSLAFAEAKSGQSVLLSPACSSFDEFSGFEERGEKFMEMVKGFQ